MAVERKLITAEELLRLPGGTGERYELLDGELRKMPAAGGRHGLEGFLVVLQLGNHILTNGLGVGFLAETGFLIRRDPDRVRAPDFAFIGADRLPPEGLPRGYVPIPPDMVLEVVSPNDTAAELQEKIEDWLAFGTRAVWVLYAGPRLHVHLGDGSVRTFGPGEDVDGGDFLPGFRMTLRDLVRPPRR